MGESEYEIIIRERYEPDDDMSYSDECTLELLLNGPEQYGNEEEMLEYVKKNPDASMGEVFDYWKSITPPGLPKGIDPEELLKDEDE